MFWMVTWRGVSFVSMELDTNALWKYDQHCDCLGKRTQSLWLGISPWRMLERVKEAVY
jgi:hypothetical protein